MKQHRVVPDVVTYNAWISDCEKSQPNLAPKMFRAMQWQGMVPSFMTYSALIGACEKGQQPKQALEMLNSLPSNFRGDPGVFLNRRMPDGHNPIDVAVRYGGVDVASALVSHGARFMPTHLAEAQRRGHSELAALIDTLLRSQ